MPKHSDGGLSSSRQAPPNDGSPYYTHRADIPIRGGELYPRDRRMIGTRPTNEQLVLTYIAAPAGESKAFKRELAALARFSWRGIAALT